MEINTGVGEDKYRGGWRYRRPEKVYPVIDQGWIKAYVIHPCVGLNMFLQPMWILSISVLHLRTCLLVMKCEAHPRLRFVIWVCLPSLPSILFNITQYCSILSNIFQLYPILVTSPNIAITNINHQWLYSIAVEFNSLIYKDLCAIVTEQLVFCLGDPPSVEGASKMVT